MAEGVVRQIVLPRTSRVPKSTSREPVVIWGEIDRGSGPLPPERPYLVSGIRHCLQAKLQMGPASLETPAPEKLKLIRLLRYRFVPGTDLGLGGGWVRYHRVLAMPTEKCDSDEASIASPTQPPIPEIYFSRYSSPNQIYGILRTERKDEVSGTLV